MVSIGKLLIVALIIALLFGTKKLRTLGSDLGESIKGFKKAMSDDNTSTPTTQQHDVDFDVKTISEKNENTQQSISSEQQDKQPKE